MDQNMKATPVQLRNCAKWVKKEATRSRKESKNKGPDQDYHNRRAERLFKQSISLQDQADAYDD